MTGYLGLIGSLIASSVALFIATMGWRRSDQRAQQDKDGAAARERATLLAKLLELHLDAVHAKHLGRNDAMMKAILLRLPGHLATTLRSRLELKHTMKDVPLDPASAARLRPAEEHDAGHKWLIFDRSSVLTGRSFQPYPEWIEAELAYDIAGQLGGDQDAVLLALSKDARNPKDAAIAMLQQAKSQNELEGSD
ncbi:hypothetical protein [Amycolatopsis sp. cmx-4-61]|uniref:hypothetical protein n=1 Tax=Amycolatopsis sp. cmx-4-61 TaxID=2790937 RepID=UPI003977F531